MSESHYFFHLYYPFIKILNCDSEIKPEEGNQIYSSELIKYFIGEEYKVLPLRKDEDEQIISLENNSKLKFIIKRRTSKYIVKEQLEEKEEDKQLLEDSHIKKFLNEGLKECFISRLIRGHPANVLIYSFAIIKLFKLKILLFEILMENVGMDLKDFLIYYMPHNFNGITYFKQVINIMEYIESKRVAYCDVKSSNFIVDSENNLRIIDFGISQKGGALTVKTQKFLTTILGFSRGYVSPEVLDFIKRKENKLLKPGEEINPWKADVYSCGILGLLLFGALKEDPYSTFSQLDSYKEDIINHSYIENLIKNIKCENQEITTKIKYLIGICLQYDPLKRLSFKEINETLERIIEYPNEDIMNLKTKVEEILKMKNESRDQLMKKIQKLERNLELEEKKNETLLNILKEKNQSLELQMRENEDLKKKLYEEQKNNNSNLSEILNRIKKEINITQSLKEKNFSLENKIKELSKFNFLVKNKIEELKKEINRLTEQMEEKSDKILPPPIRFPNQNNYLYYININEKAAIDLHIKDVHDYKKKFRINLYYIGKKYFIDCATFKGFLFCCGGFGKYGFLNTCAILNLENYNIYYSNNLNESKADASLI